jgi:hypothetical protein
VTANQGESITQMLVELINDADHYWIGTAHELKDNPDGVRLKVADGTKYVLSIRHDE